MKGYVFEYVNENEYKKLEHSLKKYNMLAYKKLYFEFYTSLKEGKFIGVPTIDSEEVTTYDLRLPTDRMFSKVHGFLRLVYHVNFKRSVVILDRIEPISILSEGHKSELVTYKGVMISSEHSDKDMFKVHLLNMIKK